MSVFEGDYPWISLLPGGLDPWPTILCPEAQLPAIHVERDL